MDEKKYTYDDPDFLNKLVMYISERSCKLDVTLMPNIPEFIESARSGRIPWATSGDREADRRQDIEHCRLMLEQCEKHGVLPFATLKFDFERQEEPEVIYAGYSSQAIGVSGDLSDLCMHPAHFASNRKWYVIVFKNAYGESIDKTKSAILGFIDSDYTVTRIEAELNPSSGVRDHYHDHSDRDATLTASRGHIRIYGKSIPEDLDINRIRETKLPTVSRSLDGLMKLIPDS